jgi:inositol-phosphate phosphatase / L-galactose 1-phosphate phosphatase / histidinol-phosphatase
VHLPALGAATGTLPIDRSSFWDIVSNIRYLESKMTEPDLDRMVAFALDLAAASRSMTAAAMQAADPSAQFKPDRTFVTATDAAIERRLREMIAARFPDHGILGEEEAPLNPGAAHVWVLDPIDGTAAFIAGVPVYSTLIALCRDGVPVIGVMDFSAIDARFVGVAGRQTLLNGAPVAVRRGVDIARAMMSTSNPDFYSPALLPAFETLRGRTAWRIYGTAALAYGRLAQGRIDLAIDAGLKIWDYAPFVPVIAGAGGVITDWAGAPLTLDSGPCILAAGCRDLHARALDFVSASLSAGPT